MHVMSATPFDRKLARKLIDEWQADVNHVDLNGCSILIKLVQEKKKSLVEFLLSKGALMHIIDSNQKDACDYAKDNGLALEMREFLNCNKRKKMDDMRKLANLQDDRKSHMEASFKNSRASFVQNQRRRSTRKTAIDEFNDRAAI